MSPQGPWLTVITAGPLLGQSYPLRRGNQLLGRGADADVVVASPDLSRRHAYLSWDGRSASIADAGSTNGTIVNGEAIGQTRALHAGDILRLGALELRFEVSGADATGETTALRGPQQWHNQFNRDNYGPIHQAGRDVNVQNRHDYQLALDEPMDELFQGRGLGRLLMVIGLLVALSGFAGWMYLILSAGPSIDDPSAIRSFDREVFGLPAALVAFGAFALGGVIASVGASMSKAARTRERSRERSGQIRSHRR